MPEVNLFCSSNISFGAVNVSPLGSQFSINFPNPIKIPQNAKNIALHLHSLGTFYTYPNISVALQNNTIFFTDDTSNYEKYPIVFPNGLYSIDLLSDAVAFALNASGFPTDLISFTGNLATQKVITTVSKKTEITKPYDLSVIASMPASYFQTLRRESVQSRLACAEDSHVGKIGEKVQLTIEVLRSSYSVKFNTWYITGINSENFAVFFSYREQLEIGVTVTVSGTVKRHADRATQLTRVKLVNKE
jgi:hypothetical protein